MRAAFKAELRKLLSVRSTYVILGLSLLLTVFFAFFVAGWQAKSVDLARHSLIAEQVTSAVQPLSLLFGLAAILLVTHEYRYNTIVYTLTANRSRTKVLLAKYLTVSVFGIVAALFFGTLSPLATALGIHLHHLHVSSQSIPLLSLFWRVLFAGWGYVSLAFILAVIIRVQVGAIASMFLIPSTLENLLGLLLKTKQAYLPFTSLSILLDVGSHEHHLAISYARAAVVASIYIVVGWLIALILFLRRDAS